MLLFVNEYQHGKYVLQTRFPVPFGILSRRGKDVLSVAVWAQSKAGAR
ncbi:Beta-galactosidase [Pyrenophora tritici-repentis]|uniref:Beta-galactosidase n=1 Tax=Pyrenophora tritici-repentis TaxID=45151 RepID=A0A5M9LLS0_9PLEO|nr:Beta-galactosidase [Pyrenophora tritici-repentis]KAF7454887.1 Beta-galactosidase [Pyrenophora tritici-repentis]KAF7578033.1 hypothetical protein PtrM4_022730 [Pyrenophora tritici-repentis]KAI0579201.1 Beta-galactosidase [Pyrenophora tritici-repentis]KAI0583878.1 Beta-galactosidase [Pyrenophora tritici-repentis]